MSHESAETLDKVLGSPEEAVAQITDGASIMFGGFGQAGFPFALRDALARRRLKDLTVICNNGDFGSLAYNGGLVKLICSYPMGPTSAPVLDGIESGRIELELTPQGTLAERIHAGGAGLGGILTPTGLGAEFSSQFEIIETGGRQFLLVPPLRADFAFIRASLADRYGNLVHRYASRNLNPIMAMAADLTIAEVDRVVEPGDIDPDHVHVPSAFVDRVVVRRGLGQ